MYRENIEDFEIGKPDFSINYPTLFVDFLESLNLEYESVCEIGAGYGRNLLYLRKLGKKVRGIEPSSAITERAKEWNLEIKQGVIEDLDTRSDLIMMRHVFEHLYDPEDSLLRIRKYVGKYLFIEVPGIIERMACVQNAHNYYFTPNTLDSIITKNGFKQIALKWNQKTEFIFAVYERCEVSKMATYDRQKEVDKVLKIYNSDNFRFRAKKILVSLGIYNLMSPLRTLFFKFLRKKY